MGLGSSLPEVMSEEAPTRGPVDGEGVPRRLIGAGDPPTIGKYGAEIDNIYSQFARAANLYPDNECMGKRPVAADGTLGPFEWVTYSEVHARVRALGSGVAGLKLPDKSTFGMYMVNCMEFQICAMACFSRGFTCVPIYDTLGDDIVRYEVNHADVAIMFVEDKKLKAVASVIKDCPSLKHVVQLTPVEWTAADAKTISDARRTLWDMKSLEQKGIEAPVEVSPAKGDDLAFIMYTSGTTGDPKGACIKQISITIGSSYTAGLEMYPTDRYLSFLPLAHIFETMVENGILASGGGIGFFNGNIKKLSEDILELKPTIFVGVPRVYQRFYDGAMAKIAALSGVTKSLLEYLLAAELDYVKAGRKTMYGTLLGKLLGAKVHGGRVRLMISGAAPLPTFVQEFLVAAMGCSVVQGYGMTENCANATLAMLQDIRAGHVGPPMPTVEVKLVDVPEMNYTTKDNNSGEVCTRGTINFAGYHKNPTETNKVLEPSGWLHTGDIGRWNADGTLSIIDRKKNIFKLSQGEYIAAEKIEMCVSKSKYVSQPWIYGNSFFPMLVAVVTPDFVELKTAAKEGGWFCESTEELAAKPEAKKFILDAMIAEGKAAKLKTFELPQAVHLEGKINELLQGFSVDNDCLTPTFKIKRPQMLKRYKAEVDAMYRSLGEDPSKAKV